MSLKWIHKPNHNCPREGSVPNTFSEFLRLKFCDLSVSILRTIWGTTISIPSYHSLGKKWDENVTWCGPLMIWHIISSYITGLDIVIISSCVSGFSDAITIGRIYSILYILMFTSSLKLQNISHTPQTMAPVLPYLELVNNIYKVSLNRFCSRRPRLNCCFYCLPSCVVKRSGKRAKMEMCTSYKLNPLQAISSSAKRRF